MTRRFTHDTNFISELRKAAVFNPIAIISLPLSFLFYILGLSKNKEILSPYEDEIPAELAVFQMIKIFFWVGLILTIVLCIMYAGFISSKDYVKATNCGAAMCGYAGAESLIYMFNGTVAEYSEISNMKSFFTIFFILFFAVFVGQMAYPKFIEKKTSVIVENLQKSYLELSENGISGLNITNSLLPSNGSYFEIAYEDVRNVRTAQPDPQTKQYFNLFIDTKFGTFNMLIDQYVIACDTIKKAVNDTLSGTAVDLYAIKETHHYGFSKKAAQAQYQANSGEWYCPNCGKPNANYVGTCGCGTKKP